MQYDMYVMKKDGCVFDMVYVAPPGHFAEGTAGFPAVRLWRAPPACLVRGRRPGGEYRRRRDPRAPRLHAPVPERPRLDHAGASSGAVALESLEK